MRWVIKKRNGVIKSAEAQLGQFRLSVHHYVHCGDDWFASCHFFSARPLKSKNLDEAKCQAAAMVQVILEEALSAINSA